MPPKKPGKEAISENSWRTYIEDARLDEENWKIKVVIIESAGSDQDRIYLNKFETYSAEEKRFVIKNICKTETIFMINQLGGDKKVKDDNLRVFEEGQAFLKNKEDIPPDVLALIIKHLILKMKEDNLFIRRQRLEVKLGISRESATMINRTEVRGTVNVISEPDPPPPPPKPKGKKDKDDSAMLPEPDAGKKYNTVLRVRGEEWRDRVYVDDFPVDGPHLYVAITGFVEPYLASSLIKIGIPLAAIVQVRIDPSGGEVPSSLSRATKRGQSQTELLTEMSLKFWEELQMQRINKNMADLFKNTAFIVFSPPYWEKEALSGNPEKIYDELSFLLYDVQDLTRQHLNYLDNMDIVKVPEDKVCEHFYRHYYQSIADIPLECVTMYSVLDSLLRVVCEDKVNSESSTSEAVIDEPISKSLPDDERKEKAEAMVKAIFRSLCKTDATKKKYRSTFGEEYETHKDPIVINYGDFVKNNTFHLENIDLNNIVESSLYCMPINKLWQLQDRPYGEQEAKINLHVNVLLSCFERADVETTELKRLIHILSCRKLYNNRSSLKKRHLQTSTISDFKKIYLKRSVLAEPLPRIPSITRSVSSTLPSFPSMTKYENDTDLSSQDDTETSRIKFLFDCPDIRELVSATEIVSEKPHKHLIDDFEYFEDFFGVCALQVMTDAFIKFNCVDYKYCEVTDCFVLMFFNSSDMDGIAREEWRCHLMTPLCLQDFFDFDLEEHYDWIQEEEEKYGEKEDIKIQSMINLLGDSVPSCLENLDVGQELLMEGSLKFQEAAELEDAESKSSESPTMTISTKKTISPSVTDPSVRKNKSPASSTPRGKRKKSLIVPVMSDTSYNIPKKEFLGYDLGDRRVEAFGKDSTYFSRDGTQVKTLYTLVIPMNIEYIAMEVVPGNGYNEFWLHRALSEVSQDILDTCESFRITCRDQMMIKLKKQTYRLPVPVINISEAVKTKDDFTDKSSFPEPIFETESFHSLIITWPNGLITESVHELDSPQISHIKQFQTVPNSEEQMRCISLNGEVVIFKTNGDVEILKPDGTYIKVLRYSKKSILPDIPEDELSEVSIDKSKKGKKNKNSKSSMKSKSSDEEKPDELEKPGEYELVIEEFELIEASGLRQKWVNDNSIDIEKYVVRTATDYCLGEIFSKRMDGMTLLLNNDGVYLVTFPNGTKIITYCIIEDTEIYPEWTEEEREHLDMIEESNSPKSNQSTSPSQHSEMVNSEASFASSHKDEEDENEEKSKEKRTDGYISIEVVYKIEHINFTTVTINKHEGRIFIDSPNGTQVVAHTDNTFDITLDKSTKAKFNGQNLRIIYEACPECESFTTCDIKIKYDDISSVSKLQQKWLVMKDSFCKKVIVNEEGNISLFDEDCSEDTIPTTEEVVVAEETTKVFDEKPSDTKSETSEMSHGKCREVYLAKTVKFFVQQRDLSCSELVHRSLLERWQVEHRWQPWYSANHYDTFGDNRTLLSVLSPIHLTESEKWLMESCLSNKPKHLTYKDLKKDDGKGWYHWMRPFERFQPVTLKPANVLPPRLPRAYILRVLEQQWPEAKKDKLKGAQELIIAILKYRNLLQQDLDTILHMPIVDLRPEDERQMDDVLQALGERIYKELETRLDDDVRSRAKPNITTKPQVSDDVSVEDEIEEEPDYTRIVEQERESQLTELEEVAPTSANLQRYWRRRKEELNEEQFYLYLLREGSVPPYFRNVLGGAIWWEMNDTAGEAVTKAERNKMKCICAEKEKKPKSSKGSGS